MVVESNSAVTNRDQLSGRDREVLHAERFRWIKHLTTVKQRPKRKGDTNICPLIRRVNDTRRAEHCALIHPALRNHSRFR